MSSDLQLLVAGPAPAGLPAAVVCGDLASAAERLADTVFDAVLIVLPDTPATLATWPALSQACLDAAVLLVTDTPTPALATDLLGRGVQAVLATADASPGALERALQQAVQRKRIEREARKAYATDLATGLPNQTQLLEHMNHLLALREREPGPMALLVLRVEGLASAEAALGAAAAGALRRKLAVRLRASLRASDVVASVGGDAFAALLAWIDAPAAAERVGTKLVRALQRPLRVVDRDLAVAASVGIAHYPEQGRDAQTLLRLAFAGATGAAAIGRAGFANIVERGPATAANDEAAD